MTCDETIKDPEATQPAVGQYMRVGLRHCGNYELLEEVARGGMGVFYRAKDSKLDRIVAIKMILDRNLASQKDIERFQVEAKAAAQLSHPGIVPVYDMGEQDGYHYYVRGGTTAIHQRGSRYRAHEWYYPHTHKVDEAPTQARCHPFVNALLPPCGHSFECLPA